MAKKRRRAPTGFLSSQQAVEQNPLAYLGENVMVMILGCLAAGDCARCTLVSKHWRELAASDELWMRHCMVRDSALTCVHDMPDDRPKADETRLIHRTSSVQHRTLKWPSCKFRRKDRLKSKCRPAWGGTRITCSGRSAHRSQRRSFAAFAGSSGEPTTFVNRHLDYTSASPPNTVLSTAPEGGKSDPWCTICRFKRQAGEYWLSWDPFWTKVGPQMQRVFHEDGTVLGMPSHEPFWFQDSECRYVSTHNPSLTIAAELLQHCQLGPFELLRV